MTFAPRRLEFSTHTKRDAFKRSCGVCECHLIPWLKRPKGCGVKLTDGTIFYEHINPDSIRQDNSIDNAACLTKTCWAEKTNTYDKPVIARSEPAARPCARAFAQYLSRLSPEAVTIKERRKCPGWLWIAKRVYRFLGEGDDGRTHPHSTQAH